MTLVKKDTWPEKRIGAPDLREVIELHTKASKELKQHQEDYEARLAAGETAAAEKALHRVRKLETVVRALRAHVK